MTRPAHHDRRQPALPLPKPGDNMLPEEAAALRLLAKWLARLYVKERGHALGVGTPEEIAGEEEGGGSSPV